MGYREDVVVAYTAEVWDELTSKIQSNIFTDKERADIISFIDDAVHSVNDDNEHCLMWYSIKTYADDAELLYKRLHPLLNQNGWFSCFLGEDGATEYDGNWVDNPFNIGVSHALFVETDSCETLSSSGLVGTYKVKQPDIVISDDYTCQRCQNSKLSVQETVCWKCGESIKIP